MDNSFPIFDILFPLFFFLFFFGILAASVLYANYAMKKDKEKLIIIAKELGLEMVGGVPLQNQKKPSFLSTILAYIQPWSIRGNWEGIPIEIFQETRGSGKSQTVYTVVKHELKKSLPFEMEITRQILLEGFFVGLFNLQDIQVGNKALDDAYRIKGRNEKEIQSLLKNSNIQTALLRLHSLPGEILFTHVSITMHIMGQVRDSETFREYFRAFQALLKELDNGNSGYYNPFE